MNYPPIRVKIWGELASFTRPEGKVERVSYECPTPSAMRGLLEAIYWHPQMQWRVREIWVLNPIKFTSFTTNEVKGRATLARAKALVADEPVEPFVRMGKEGTRQMRHNLILRDVSYLIQADIVVLNGEDNPGKHRAIFGKRLARGACHSRPYLGIREYAAHFSAPDGSEQPIPITKDLGCMLFDMEYTDEGRGTPRFFDAQLERGVLYVPQDLYRRGGEG